MRYRASKRNCDVCTLKPRCCPGQPQRKVLRSVHEGAREPDPDGDGRSTASEMTAAALDRVPTSGSPAAGGRERFYPWFDQDGDGTVQLAEILMVLDRVFAEFDRDFDRRLSDWETSLYQIASVPAKKRVAARQAEERRRRDFEQQVLACAMPQPAAGDQFVLLSLAKGGAVTDLWVGAARPATRLIELVD